MYTDEVTSAASRLAAEYVVDIDGDKLISEMLSLKSIHKDNFKANTCSPYKILNEISRLDLKELFPEVVAVLKIFLTIPVTEFDKV